MTSLIAICARPLIAAVLVWGSQVKTSADVRQVDDHPQLVIRLAHRAGVHTWPNRPIVPPEFKGLKPIATTARVLELKGATVRDSAQWPAAERVMVRYTGAPIGLHGYAGNVEATFDLKRTPGAAEISGRVAIRYQPCDERLCYAPRTDTISFRSVP